jgi:peroxiredoxin
MRHLTVTLVSITALMSGLYLSAKHFAEPLTDSRPPIMSSSSRSASPARPLTTALVGGPRPDFRLGSNRGELVSAADFAGKTLLINFWATWCAPCRQEMPMLMDLQREYGATGLQIVGIALDDAQSVRSFVQTFGITYPILIGESDVFETSAAYGNAEGVLPYSVLVDKSGIVRWQYAGKIHSEDVTSLLNDLL